MAGQYSSSSSSGSGTSSSTPNLLQSPQSEFGLQLSQLLSNLGQYQYNWAQSQFQKASAVTDAQINNYITTAQQGSNLAANTGGRYASIYAPMADQFAQYAGQYSSEGRIRHNMGRAESDAAQAGNAAKINAERQLQSFGIDPSSGRYADLELASNTQTAANAAAAGERARVNTEQTGRNLKTQAIQIGQQLPGATVNALNSTYQGISGAENSALGLANTGVNLTQSAAPYMTAASGAIKLPPVGNTATSEQRSGSGSFSHPGSSSGNYGGNQGNRAGQGNQPSSAPSGGKQSNQSASPAVMSGQPNPGVQKLTGQPDAGVYGGDQWAGGEPSVTGNNDPGNIYNPDTGTWGDQGGVIPNDVSGNPVSDYTGGYGQTPGQGNYGIPESNSGNYAPQVSGNYGGSYSGGGYGGGYRKGGAVGRGVLRMAGGGGVPQSMSPSGGQQVDDVPAQIPQTGGKANLNVGEFVIPQQVVMWKGQEFFQNLIKKSMQARLGGPAKPKMSSAPQGAQ